MNSGSHASTLDRLYAWERKLYDEVKVGFQLEYFGGCLVTFNSFNDLRDNSEAHCLIYRTHRAHLFQPRLNTVIHIHNVPILLFSDNYI